jgi:hypothetical protein
MKLFRNILSGTFIFLCLFCSCSLGGTDLKKSVTPEEEGIEEEAENPDEDEEEDEEDEAEDILEEIPPAPVFLNFKTLPGNEVVFRFSGPVSFVSLDLNPKLGFKVIEEGSEVKIKLMENPEPGLPVEADLLVEDEYENIVGKQVSFRTRNNHVPEMKINELRTEYDKPKAEFIEFKMLTDGNLGALRVFAEGNNKAPQIYEFKPVEVKEGEYVVLHLRTLEDSYKDEYGEDLNESGGTDSSATARDLWIAGSTELLRKTDVVYVLDQDDNVLDAVMIAETPSPSWNKPYFAEVAEFLFSRNAWKSPAGTVCSPEDAVNSSGTTATKSISRDEAVENNYTKAGWYVTKTSGATPGLPNIQ